MEMADTLSASKPEIALSPAASGRLRGHARWSLGLVLPLGAALVWEIVVRLGLSSGRLVPPPSRVFTELFDLARSGELALHVTATLTRVLAGFGFGVIAGTILGAILSVDRKIVEVGRTFRLSGPAMIRRILLPAVLPEYVVALRVGLGLGWMFVVAAELTGASEGLGFLLLDGQQLGKPAQILAAIVVFAVLGKITDWLIVTAMAPLLRWQDAFGRQGETA